MDVLMCMYVGMIESGPAGGEVHEWDRTRSGARPARREVLALGQDERAERLRLGTFTGGAWGHEGMHSLGQRPV